MLIGTRPVQYTQHRSISIMLSDVITELFRLVQCYLMELSAWLYVTMYGHI